MEDNAGAYYILNGETRKSLEAAGNDSAPDKAAYEVLRVIDGVPLFYEDHFERLKGTFSAIGKPLEITSDQLKKTIRDLLAANNMKSCNVKVIITQEQQKQTTLVYISKSYYPSEEEADAGVKTGLLRLERNNPNAKLVNKTYKQTVNDKIAEGGFFEVLLADNAGRLTEGSRSNAFFVRNNKIYTAPGASVLKGITRKYVLQACSNAGCEVVEEFIEADKLPEIEAAFLSGTSIKVLPIAEIDELRLNSSANPVVAAVRREYDKLLKKYIDENVNLW